MRNSIAICLFLLISPLHAQEPILPTTVLRADSLTGSPYSSLALTRDGKALVLHANRQGLLRLAEAETGRQLAAMDVTTKHLTRFQLFPNDQTLIASDQNRLYLWNMKSNRMQAVCPDAKLNPELELLSDFAVSGDGSTLVTFYRMYVGHKDHFTFQAWDPATGKKLGDAVYTYPMIGNTAKHHLALSHDGRRLAVFQRDYYYYPLQETTIHFWDLATHPDGKTEFKERSKLNISGKRVTQIIFHPQGKDFVVAADEVKQKGNFEVSLRHFLLLYQLDTLKEKRCTEVPVVRGTGHLAYNQDGTFLAEFDIDHATVLETNSWQPCLELRRDAKDPRWPDLRGVHFIGENQVQFTVLHQSQAGRWLVDLQRPGQLSPPPLPILKKLPMRLNGRTAALQLTSDQTQLITTDEHGWINLWDMNSRQLVKSYYVGHPYKNEEDALGRYRQTNFLKLQTVLSPSAEYLLREGRGVHLLLTNLATGEHRQLPLEIDGKPGPHIYLSVGFSGDSAMLLTEWYDQRQNKHLVRMWETNTGKILWTRHDLAYATSYFRFENSSRSITNGVLVLQAATGKSIKVCAVPYPPKGSSSNDVVRQLPKKAFVFNTILLSDERSLLALVLLRADGKETRELYWVERFTREVRASYCLPSREAIGRLQFSGDGQRILATNEVDDIYVWNLCQDDAPHRTPLTPADLKRHWTTLAQQPAAPAWQAMQALIREPSRTIPFLMDHIKFNPNWGRIDALIADLDHSEFKSREQASQALQGMGNIAQSALQQAAQSSSPECSRRARLLLQSSPELDLQFLRCRAIELLERLGTPQAIPLLERLTKEASPNPLTEEARAALLRMRARLN